MRLILLALLSMLACAPAATPAPDRASAPASPTSPPTAGGSAATTPGSRAPASEAPLAPRTLMYGTTQLSSEVGVYVALEKGYLREQGINLEMMNFRAQQEMIAPLSTGELDVGSSPVSLALLNAADRGIPLKIVADMGQNRPGFNSAYFLLRRDLWDSGEVKTFGDLPRGTKIAIPAPVSLAEITADLLLTEAGMTREDVEIGVIPFADQPAAFANKAIATALSAEPGTARAVEAGFAVKWIPLIAPFKTEVQAAVIVYPPKTAQDVELGRRWVVAYLKGIRTYLDGFVKGQARDEIVSILTKYTAAKDPRLYDIMELGYPHPDGTVLRDSIETQYKWYVEKGHYTGRQTFAELIDTSFVDYAVNRLGKY